MMIVPSILSDSLDIVQSEVDKVSEQTKLTRIQIDVIDPDFADEITIQPIDILELNLRNLEIDIHLMTNDPINDVVECSQIIGIKTIIAQIERMPSQKAFIEHVESLGIQAGLSLDIHTPVDEVDTNLWEKIALIQVMGNTAGRQGQPFAGDIVLEKIQQLKQLKNDKHYTFLIAVDIGMSPENAKACEMAGADMVTPGSYLWKAPNIQTAIEAFSQKL